MCKGIAALALLAALFIAAAPVRPQRAAKTRVTPKRAARATPTKKPDPPTPPPCGDYIGFQVLLDRQGFSPGSIDGKPGDNFSHALAALQQARRLPVTGQADCDTWHALGGEHAEPTIATYTISDEDVKGPFEKAIPRTIAAQAKLPALGYASLVEELGERFHASPALLREMNVGIPFEAGKNISVPAVTPFDPDVKPTPASAGDDVAIQVTRDDSGLRALKPDGTVVFFAPVTTGSAHDPLPTGEWKVTGFKWYPVFHYNPNLFWDAKPRDAKTDIKPGPNNPVGVVWIGLTLEHYGLHGTPQPENVGHAQSHGCVRLTNWDAARVAALVKPGTPVVFR